MVYQVKNIDKQIMNDSKEKTLLLHTQEIPSQETYQSYINNNLNNNEEKEAYFTKKDSFHLPVKLKTSKSKRHMQLLSIAGFICSIGLLLASIIAQPVIPFVYSKINEFGSRYYGIMIMVTSILWVLLIFSQLIFNYCCNVKKKHKCRLIYSFFIITPILMMLIWSVIIMINLKTNFSYSWSKDINCVDSWFENYYNCCGYNSTNDRPMRTNCTLPIVKGCKNVLLFDGYIFYSVFIGITFIGFIIEILIIINFTRRNTFNDKYSYIIST